MAFEILATTDENQGSVFTPISGGIHQISFFGNGQTWTLQNQHINPAAPDTPVWVDTDVSWTANGLQWMRLSVGIKYRLNGTGMGAHALLYSESGSGTISLIPSP